MLARRSSDAICWLRSRDPALKRQEDQQVHAWENVPNGPLIVIVFSVVVSYVVILFFTTGSPTVISTPGGIESGVLPSLLDRLVVAENGRLEANGTVVLGVAVFTVEMAPAAARTKGLEVPIARQSDLPLRPVTVIAAIGGRGRCLVTLQLRQRRASASRRPGSPRVAPNFLSLSHRVTCGPSMQLNQKDVHPLMV